MLYQAKESKINVSNMQFDYITFGSGAKPLIMIQGLNTRGIKGAAVSLAYTYRMFTKDYKVYLFDRRPVLHDGITVGEMASDVAAAMDALGIRNADVLGVSQGGMIAQYLAIGRPDLVRRMVLAVTLSKNNETVARVIDDWIDMSKRGAMKELVADMAEKLYSETYVKKYRPLMPLLTILQKPRDVDRFVTLAKSCLTCDTYERLGEIKCPTLVIGGRQDKVVTGEASEEMAKKIGCRLHMYDGLGHAAYEEASDFNQIVYDFLMD